MIGVVADTAVAVRAAGSAFACKCPAAVFARTAIPAIGVLGIAGMCATPFADFAEIALCWTCG